MSDAGNYIPFSQRNGLVPVPPQLRLGEVSKQLRLLLDYCIDKEIGRVRSAGYGSYYFEGAWEGLAADFHVRFLGNGSRSFENNSDKIRVLFERNFAQRPLGELFDLVEFLMRHPASSSRMKADLAEAFVSARAAYRIVDGQIVAIGTEEQAAAFEDAIAKTELSGASASRRHLLEAGAALRNGSWADSVRESIHAVEAMARRINPQAKTLGEALKTLERGGYIHGSLKSAFEKLYGYTNDEDGIRHALSGAEARVDEADALFMLGACAAFVSYLVSREAARPVDANS